MSYKLLQGDETKAKRVTHVASGAVLQGAVVAIGDRIGVNRHVLANGETGVAYVATDEKGVIMPKATGVISAQQKVYWDANGTPVGGSTTGAVVTTPGASGLKSTTATGGAAGPLTATGVLATDRLVSVYNATDDVDLTSEFTITDDDEIDNTGGTATTGDTLLVLYETAEENRFIGYAAVAGLSADPTIAVELVEPQG